LLVKSFTNGTARKIEGVCAGKAGKFKSTIAVNAKVRILKFGDILTVFLHPFSKDY
jgi:phage shock protein PspC (stress-responsive transcriptional regulator)